MSELEKYEEQEYFAHIPKQSKAFADYATDVAFLWSRYIFTQRRGNLYFGFCTHCKTEYLIDRLKHNSVASCLKCGSRCTVKTSGLGRTKMIDEVYFVWYEKSISNPQILIAIGIYAIRDYRGDYHQTETAFEMKAVYIFEPGKSRMISRSAYFSRYSGEGFVGRWQKGASVHSLPESTIRTYCSHESIKVAIKDIPFRYSTWESYLEGDMVKFFDLYSKYPCIEHLTKLGVRGIVDAKLNGYSTYSAINWRGKTPQKILKVSKTDLNDIRASGVKVNPLALRLYQISKQDGSNLSMAETSKISEGYGCYLKDLQKILRWTTLRKVNLYMNKQILMKVNNKKHYYSSGDLLTTWRDYISECGQLQMDLSQEVVLFPADLYTAHQETISRIKTIEDKKFNENIRKQVKALQKYCFEDGGLQIRPVAGAEELVKEGNALHHCVGRYAEKYSKGECAIFVIRKVDAPDKPFYTVEVRAGSITQCRGLGNCSPTPEVKSFIDTFTAKKLLTKKRTRVDVTNINQQMEDVAV